MNELQDGEITLLLKRHREGDPAALHQLLPIVYSELRRLAGHWLRKQPPGSAEIWQPTELVNELFVRLFDAPPNWQNRQHFFGTASLRMRSLLIDDARRAQAEKRGGGVPLLALEEAWAVTQLNTPQADVLALDDALRALAGPHPRAAKVVELRFFTGLSVVETACVLAVNEKTVRRDWEFAKGWLLAYLKPLTK